MSSSPSITSYSSSVAEGAQFTVKGEADCESAIYEAEVNGDALSLNAADCEDGKFTVKGTAPSCVSGELNVIRVTVTVPGCPPPATCDIPISCA